MMLFVSSMPMPMFVPEFVSLKEEFGITPLPKSNVKLFKKEMTLKRCVEIDPRFGKHPILTRVLFKTFEKMWQIYDYLIIATNILILLCAVSLILMPIPQTYFVILASICVGSFMFRAISNKIVIRFSNTYWKISNIASVGWNKIPYYTYRAHADDNDINIPPNVGQILDRVDKTYPVTVHVFDRDPFASIGTWPNEQYIICWNRTY